MHSARAHCSIKSTEGACSGSRTRLDGCGMSEQGEPYRLQYARAVSWVKTTSMAPAPSMRRRRVEQNGLSSRPQARPTPCRQLKPTPYCQPKPCRQPKPASAKTRSTTSRQLDASANANKIPLPESTSHLDGNLAEPCKKQRRGSKPRTGVARTSRENPTRAPSRAKEQP